MKSFFKKYKSRLIILAIVAIAVAGILDLLFKGLLYKLLTAIF